MFVVELAGVHAVVELAEEFVEQVPLGLMIPVCGSSACVEVTTGPRGSAQRCQGPDGAYGVEAAVFDMAFPRDRGGISYKE